MYHLREMIQICYEICCNSEMKKVNIWDVIMTFKKKDGDVERIGDARRPESILDKSKKAQKNAEKGTYTYTAFMALYFSLGEDAKIGFDFEANRTASRCGNFCRYACSGMKRFFCGCCFWTTEE